MIKFLGNWIEGIAIAVIMVSIFEMLLPKGNLKKYIKVILGIYVIFNILSPFVDSNALYSLNISDTIEEYTNNMINSTTSDFINSSSELSGNTANATLEKMYLDTLESQIINAVENQGYIVKSCNVDAVFDTSQEDIGIKKIDIVISNLYDKVDEKNSEEDENISNIEDIEKVEIKVGKTENEEVSAKQKVTQSNIIQLKKYLSEHYEIDRNIINIQIK